MSTSERGPRASGEAYLAQSPPTANSCNGIVMKGRGGLAAEKKRVCVLGSERRVVVNEMKMAKGGRDYRAEL